MKTFEEQITALEEIVHKLEGGNCSLDDSLKLFEEGIKLARGMEKEKRRQAARGAEDPSRPRKASRGRSRS